MSKTPEQSSNPAKPANSAGLSLFPEIEPYDSGYLYAGEGHEIYYEQCGNPSGLPVVFLHGGPGSGCSPRHRRFFDPTRYRICLFDQRGSGRSKPHGERSNSSTDKLVGDIEALRHHLKIDRWLVFGGSWGSALALAYAGQHQAACLALVLRGIFLSGQADMDWFFEHSAQLVPDAWQRFSGHVGQTQSREILLAYTVLLEDVASPEAVQATAHWLAWEATLSAPGKPAAKLPDNVKVEAVRQYRLHAAYLNRLCDLGESAVLRAAAQAASVPTVITHGRLDWVCRPSNALRLAETMPNSKWRLLADAAHDPFSPPMTDALISATNLFAEDGHFGRWQSDGSPHEP
ncbi:MAG: prolyl aminopeptidase [Burkholderiaceae bacterium]